MAAFYVWDDNLVSAPSLVYCLLVSPVVVVFCYGCCALLVVLMMNNGFCKNKPQRPRRDWQQVPEICRLVAKLHAYNQTPVGAPLAGISTEEVQAAEQYYAHTISDEIHVGQIQGVWRRKLTRKLGIDPNLVRCASMLDNAERPGRRLLTLVSGIKSDLARPLHSQMRQMPNHLLHLIATVVATQRSTVLKCLEHALELEEQRYMEMCYRMKKDMGNNIGFDDGTLKKEQ